MAAEPIREILIFLQQHELSQLRPHVVDVTRRAVQHRGHLQAIVSMDEQDRCLCSIGVDGNDSVSPDRNSGISAVEA